jgi:hypothetical protein
MPNEFCYEVDSNPVLNFSKIGQEMVSISPLLVKEVSQYGGISWAGGCLVHWFVISLVSFSSLVFLKGLMVA